MSISGHKSTNSLQIYQHVDNEEKIKMEVSLSHMLNTDDPETVRQKADQAFQSMAQRKKSAFKCQTPQFDRVETPEPSEDQLVTEDPEDPIPNK